MDTVRRDRVQRAAVGTMLVCLLSALLTVCAPAASAATTPGAPTIGAPTAGNAAVTVYWRAPASTGAGAITSYRVRAYRGTTVVRDVVTGASARRTTVPRLTNGTAYRFSVTAENARGAGPRSALSVAVVPATRPGPPRLAEVTEGPVTDGTASAVVRWSAPTTNGGSPVTGYVARVYTLEGWKKTVSVGPTVRQATVSGLPRGSSYAYFADVVAVNATGTGSPSQREQLLLTLPAGVMPTVTAHVVSCTMTGEVNDLGWYTVHVYYTVSGGAYELLDGRLYDGATWSTQTFVQQTTGVIGQPVPVPNAGLASVAADPRTGEVLGTIRGVATATVC